MLHTGRRAPLAVLPCLLLAGCSGVDRAAFRVPSDAARAAPPMGRAAHGIERDAASRGGARRAARTAELVGHVAPPESRYSITLDEIRQHVRNQSALIIDARGPGDFVLGHVQGAINMPAGQEEANMEELRQRVVPSALIIVYCNGPRCNSSDMVYEYLVSQGFTNMRVFRPGWKAIAAERELW